VLKKYFTCDSDIVAITLTKLSSNTSVNTTVFANDHVSVLSRRK